MADPQQRSLLSSSAEVWDRSGTDSLSRRAFLGLIGGLTFYGLALNAVLATWAMQVHFQPGLVLMLVLAIGLPLAGIFTLYIGYDCHPPCPSPPQAAIPWTWPSASTWTSTTSS